MAVYAVGRNVLFRQAGVTVFSVPLASLNSTNDYFIIEAFHPDGPQSIIVLYGVNAAGTLASGVYFDANFANITPANYPATTYVIHWQGTAPNTPLPTDTYTIVYHT